MKRVKFFIYCFMTLLTVASCTRELVPEVDENVAGETRTATFTFTPSFMGMSDSEPGTKSMASLPQIHNLYFAVFDNAGYKLNEYAQAIPNTYADQNWNPSNPTENVFSYTVTLTVTDQPRIIHIIANAPEHLLYGSEAEVIGSLNTRFEASETEGDWSDAYWVRVYLDNGVWVKPDDSTMLTDPEYQAKYDKWMHVVETLNEAKLVRNFARIVVDETADNFELTRYWLTNVPDIGSFAPYNRNTGLFQINYNTYDNISDLSSPEDGNYFGFVPASANLYSISDYLSDDSEITARQIDVSKNWTSFCYEREIPRSDPTYIIAAGRFNGGPESFYKIDLRDQDGDYFPLLRNFTYRVRITKVSTQGASSIANALSSAPSGDVDTSLEMQGLTNISNGTSQMFVSETSEIIVGEGHDIPLRFKYIPSLSTDANHDGFADAVNTVLVKDSAEEATAIENHQSYVTVTTTNGSTGAVFSSITPQPGYDSDNYSTIILHSNDAGEIIKTQTVTITGYYYNTTLNRYETISRSSNFRLRETLHMSVAFSPAKIPNGNGQPVDLVISLEAGLPSSMFSLDLDIELLGLSLTTNNDPLPITTGASMIPGNSRPAFHFQKTITWTQYDNARTVDGHKQFVCHFKTNSGTAPSLSAMQTVYNGAGGVGSLPSKPGDVVYVKNKYFVSGTSYYSTYAPKTFTSVSLDGAAEVGQSGTLSFTMESPFPNGANSTVVTVGMQGLEPSDLATYPLLGMRDGYELYQMTVYDTPQNGNEAYQGSMQIVPFDSGTCSVKLFADEYTPAEKELNVREGIYIYVNEDGAGSGDRMVVAQGEAIAPAGSVVAGQGATLTVYIAEIASGVPVTIAGKTATRSGTNYVDINGKRYYRYSINNYVSPVKENGNADITPALMDNVDIRIDGALAKRIHVPVYGIQRDEVLTRVSFDTSAWYVIQNAQTGRYLYNNNSDQSTSILHSSLDYLDLVKFGKSTSKSTIRFVNLSTNYYYYLYSSGNNNVQIRNYYSYEWTITQINNSNPFRISRGTDRYIYDNNSNNNPSIAISQINRGTPDNYRSWNVYSISTIVPE